MCDSWYLSLCWCVNNWDQISEWDGLLCFIGYGYGNNLYGVNEMFGKVVRWGVWVIGGLILLGLATLHFTYAWRMPDYLILTIGICTGMYFLMFIDAIIGEMVKSKRVKGE